MHILPAPVRLVPLAALCASLAACLAPTAPAPDRGDAGDGGDEGDGGAIVDVRNETPSPSPVRVVVTVALPSTADIAATTTRSVPDAGGPPPSDAAIQPPLPRNTLWSDRCEYRDGAPPEHARDLASSAYRRAARPLVWSLGPGDVLWLSHPALEGRTLADVAPGSARDLLVTRDPAGRVALVAAAEGVEALPNGLVATPSGALMLARVTASASVSGRPLALPAGLALLRLERATGLAWAEALPAVEAARLDQEPDGTARLLATTAAPGSLRGVAFGAAGRRLTALAFDARDAPARAVDLGPDPGPLDEVVRDLDGALRLRVGGTVLAFDPDGSSRWRAALPPGTHRLRRDGTTWTADTNCDALGVPPAGMPASGEVTLLCLSVLRGDGRTRIPRRLQRTYPPLSPAYFGTATVSFAESFDGVFSVGIAGELCSMRTTVPPERECVPDAYAAWDFRASDPDPLVGPDVSPRCFERSREGLDTRWVGEVRCRLACAASGDCPAPVDVTTPANCGAVGRACDDLLRALHQRGRCAAGECAATGCLPGWGDCNGDVGDGCEVDLSAAAAHCGACGNACAGRCDAGRCCGDGGCATGVFDSDGGEGPFAPTADVTLAAGVHRFTSIHVPAGVTVYAGEGGVLDLRATEAVRIDGAVELSGGDAYDRLGGATGRRVAGGGPAGTGSGPGGGATLGTPARGEAPGDSATGWTDPGSCGGAPWPFECVGLPRSGRADARAYGVSDYEGRHVMATFVCTGLGFRPAYACDYDNPGGGSIGPRALRDLPVLSRFEPGSGGGSARCGRNAFGCATSVAGGGGGGALRIASRVSIALGPAATLRADGGTVPYGHGDYSLQWSGGHGSGGVVSLAAPALTVAAGAYVSASSMSGGLGRIKLSVDPARCRVDGTFLPPLPRGCAPSTGDALCETYVAPWPG